MKQRTVGKVLQLLYYVAEQVDWIENSIEIGNATDEIKSVVDIEFVDFNDTQQR